MAFNSYIFILLFLPICLTGWYAFNRAEKYQAASLWTLVASLVFCGYINALYSVVIVCSIAVNYCIYLKMCNHEGTKRKTVLIIGLAIDLAALLYFKYCNFFIENINAIFSLDISTVRLLLPLGISFYTFHQISFLVDSYRGENEGCSLLDYALYISFFPKLSMGPIVKYNELMHQFKDESRRQINWDNITKGVYLFALGLSKKVLIADVFASAVDLSYQSLVNLNSVEAAFTVLSYTVQIYFDFSGYCDMAMGIGKMMNIDLPINFNSPYKSKTIIEFWKRWHITLTKFLTEYLYIPLGGNRRGKLRTYLNTMLVFLLSGFWHGASWTFVIWGAMHGAFTVLTKSCKSVVDKIPDAINWLITFAFINISWVFFRAETLSDAVLMIKRVFDFDFSAFSEGIWGVFRTPELQLLVNVLGLGNVWFSKYLFVLMFVALTALLLRLRNSNERTEQFKPTLKKLFITAILLVFSIVSLTDIPTFVYLNF